MTEYLPILNTIRLIIRELTDEDIQNVHELHSMPQTDEFNTLGIPETLLVTTELVEKWVAESQQHLRNSYVFCIQRKETSEFVGLIAISLGKINFRNAEVWFKIHADHWNKGYTTEALRSILKFGFAHLKLHRIEAGCAVENIASIRVLEKSGMKSEGMKRKNLPIRGEWKDSFSYAILAEDFFPITGKPRP
ncbi:GNAT family protein [Daejeonella sp.]|uniref:GNAT family N-acetyltransferase n=1 Tax=Daejeonella sp. TaxID=2805397 RepID=UPI0030C5085D